MYKYFVELEKLKDFKTYLIRESFNKNQDLHISNITFPEYFLKRLNKIVSKIIIIDELIMALNESLIIKENYLLPFEDQLGIIEFFQYREEIYFKSHHILKEKINLTFNDLKYILKNLYYIINYLVIFYPNYEDFLLKAQQEIKTLSDEMEIKTVIKLPSKSDAVIVTWPNSWYITPNGYLYNSGFGHKRGNLNYSYYNICDLLKHNKNIPSINYYQHINDILKRGYITYDEFQTYSNLMYKLPTVFTPEVEQELMRYKNILEMDKEEYKKMSTSEIEWPQIERSYQKNLITLIIGHLAAETSLFSSFIKINESLHKNEIITQLNHLTMNDLRDVLVRFSGFHKIESSIDNTITTSSLNGITEFSEYLKRGWNLQIIPRIIYDKNEDKLFEMDFNSSFISKYLDEQLAKYKGKGKILIKDK